MTQDPRNFDLARLAEESRQMRQARAAKRELMRVGEAKIHAFEDRQGRFIFVQVPGEYGRYCRTNVAVVLTHCPACRSEIGVPCRGQYDRYTGSCHADRLVMARRVLVQMLPGKEGGVARQIAEDGGEPPLAADDQVGDDEPGIIKTEVNLRRIWE